MDYKQRQLLSELRAEIALKGLTTKWISAGDLARELELPPKELGSTLYGLLAKGLVDSKWSVDHINKHYVRHRVYKINKEGKKFLKTKG